jgi:hypothetical protein
MLESVVMNVFPVRPQGYYGSDSFRAHSGSKGELTMFVETEKLESQPIRRTQRILARVPLSISGKNNGEAPFEEHSFTIAVNADGGLLQLREQVRKGQRLSLFHGKTGQQEFCVVAHVESIEDGLASVRVNFLEPHPEFWHVSFPPSDWTPRHPDSKFNRRSQFENSDAKQCVGLGNF